ncbi:hypothetical protein [Massilia rubra]|uniref:Uncharacterized protein n=1 Tax=Massilia rubra TaxID=2607910 RepID=A0ABX0LES2_9BURK|nr:hypothetical protein [Massilia rubra]NHZ32469.1 hypothetical protein [Massilia rubra]
MKTSKPVESSWMFQELVENIYGDTTLSQIRDLLLSFKEKGARAPQIAHSLMSVVHQNQAKSVNDALPEEVEDKLFDVIDMVCGLMSESFTIWQPACKWGTARTIFYLEELCPICKTGILGFRRVDNSKKIVIACHECESVWSDPSNVTTENVLHVPAPDFGVMELGASVFGDNAAWATVDEIQRAGWGQYVAGEEIPVY